jgi:probable rRNA maturation factor
LSNIQFVNKTSIQLRELYPWLRRLVRYAINVEGLESQKLELSIVFTHDSDMQQLNAKFRQILSPTDVLAFPADYLDPETGRKYIGDIAISMDQVKNQQEKYGDQEKDALALLVLHGTLHLLGYDHETGDEKRTMWLNQGEILSRFQINVHIPE